MRPDGVDQDVELAPAAAELGERGVDLAHPRDVYAKADGIRAAERSKLLGGLVE